MSLAATRGATTLCGLLAVDKPAGMTSHDVVAAIRRATGERRVGHGGTLDPFATGLLVVAVGPAARLTRFFLDSPKTYETLIAFGAETDTGDIDGEIVRESSIPDELREIGFARSRTAELVGRHLQVPPAFSAIKVDGRKAYQAARRGEAVDLPPRQVEVLDASLVAIEDSPSCAWRLHLTVTKGTYIRALARDLGSTLGTAAHTTALRRLASGHVSVEDALTLDDIADRGARGQLADSFLRSAEVLGFADISADDETAASVAVGRSLPAPTGVEPGEAVSLVAAGRLLAVYRREGERLVPVVVLPGGCA